jgi:Cu(I)/Ag(I) efflux system membrane fusion protein
MMKKVLVPLAVLVVLVVAGYLVVDQFRLRHRQATELLQGEEYYTCPMHPSVRSDRPGACPVCGMALVKKSSLAGKDTTGAAGLTDVSLSPVQRVMANISTVPVVRSVITRTIDAVGVVSFAEPLQATVAARFRGRIGRLHVSYTGQRVEKGKPLFELYSPDLITSEREYLLARQRTTDSSALTADINGQMLASVEERLRIHFGLTLDQIRDLASRGTVRESLTFYSPIAGTVLEKTVQEGIYVDEGTVLYKLADLSTVWILLDVYEQDLRFIRSGADVVVRSDTYPGELFTAKVTFINPVVNQETRTTQVRLEAPNLHGKLKPNMYVHGSIQLVTKDALVVPRPAVLSTGKQSVAWIEVAKNRFEPREVITGITTATQIEIVEGLSEGDLVAASGGYLIDSESSLSFPPGPRTGPATKRLHTPALGGDGASKRKAMEVRIDVDYGYDPEVIRVKAGIPVRLLFIRHENSECSREVVFKDLNIRRELPTGKLVAVEFTPTSTGEIGFECGMGMLRGKIIVE